MEFFDAPIVLSELRAAVKKLSNNKSPGHDGIPNEIWRKISFKHPQILLDLYNEALENSTTDCSWSETIICPIFKKKDPTQPVNYRPISLVPTILKLLTSILSERIQTWSKEHKKLSEYQAGFRKGMGTLEHIFTLNTLIQSKLMYPNGKLFAVFVDLKQCFESVSHDHLWKALEKLQFGSKCINLFQSIYRNDKSKNPN